MLSGSTQPTPDPGRKVAFSLRPRAVVRRLARGELYYALGRFARGRRAYSSLRVALDLVKGAPALPLAKTSAFPDLDVATSVASLRRDGIALGLKLPLELREEIVSYAETQRFIPLQGERRSAGARSATGASRTARRRWWEGSSIPGNARQCAAWPTIRR